MPKINRSKSESSLNKRSNGGTSLKPVGGLRVKGVNFYRDAKKVRRLRMLEGGKPTRDSKGNITKPADFQNRLAPGTQVHVYPERSYWENTRTIKQNQLEAFRDALKKNKSDPYSFILKSRNLPMSLLNNTQKTPGANLLEVESFEGTFGPRAHRKRPRLKYSDINELAGEATNISDKFESNNKDIKNDDEIDEGYRDAARDPISLAGQSKRIWGELYKVIDSSDVIVEVLDARIPEETRCRKMEKYIKEEKPHKHLILVLNKCDLLPNSVSAKWIKHFSKEYPTIGFKSGINNSFGKGPLITLLRQFSKLMPDKKQITVGFTGYPNTGKSSVINTLRMKKVCNVAPIPGETKVWQYITLTKHIYLVDCPGVVAPSKTDNTTDIILRCVARVENITDPDSYVQPLIDKIGKSSFSLAYDLHNWENAIQLLEMLSEKFGKLLKGGEPDISAASKIILNDWSRGNIPYYTLPPTEPISNDDQQIQVQ